METARTVGCLYLLTDLHEYSRSDITRKMLAHDYTKSIPAHILHDQINAGIFKTELLHPTDLWGLFPPLKNDKHLKPAGLKSRYGEILRTLTVRKLVQKQQYGPQTVKYRLNTQKTPEIMFTILKHVLKEYRKQKPSWDTCLNEITPRAPMSQTWFYTQKEILHLLRQTPLYQQISQKITNIQKTIQSRFPANENFSDNIRYITQQITTDPHLFLVYLKVIFQTAHSQLCTSDFWLSLRVNLWVIEHNAHQDPMKMSALLVDVDQLHKWLAAGNKLEQYPKLKKEWEKTKNEKEKYVKRATEATIDYLMIKEATQQGPTALKQEIDKRII